MADLNKVPLTKLTEGLSVEYNKRKKVQAKVNVGAEGQIKHSKSGQKIADGLNVSYSQKKKSAKQINFKDTEFDREYIEELNNMNNLVEGANYIKSLEQYQNELKGALMSGSKSTALAEEYKRVTKVLADLSPLKRRIKDAGVKLN